MQYAPPVAVDTVQLLQVWLPGFGANFPAGHIEQVEDPTPEKVPKEQGRKVLCEA